RERKAHGGRLQRERCDEENQARAGGETQADGQATSLVVIEAVALRRQVGPHPVAQRAIAETWRFTAVDRVHAPPLSIVRLAWAPLARRLVAIRASPRQGAERRVRLASACAPPRVRRRRTARGSRRRSRGRRPAPRGARRAPRWGSSARPRCARPRTPPAGEHRSG